MAEAVYFSDGVLVNHAGEPLLLTADAFADGAPWEEPGPHIDSLEPMTVGVLAGPTVIQVLGTGFAEGAMIEVDQAEEPTTFVSDTELSMTFTPTAEGTLFVTVRLGEDESNSMPLIIGT